MEISRSKSTILYRQVRRALQSGRYLPGQRIDPALLASEFGTSLTPVRFALYRLVGEGVITDQARHGFQVTLPNEVGMRDLYEWMEHLLLVAIQHGRSRVRNLQGSINDDDLAKRTWKLFNAIGYDTGCRPLHQAIRRENDRLAPIRRAKQELIDDPADELAELVRLWQAEENLELATAVRAYHQRRKKLVPCIVALLTERSSRLH